MKAPEFLFLAALSVVFPVLPVVAGVVLLFACLGSASAVTPSEEVSP